MGAALLISGVDELVVLMPTAPLPPSDALLSAFVRLRGGVCGGVGCDGPLVSESSVTVASKLQCGECRHGNWLRSPASSCACKSSSITPTSSNSSSRSAPLPWGEGGPVGEVSPRGENLPGVSRGSKWLYASSDDEGSCGRSDDGGLSANGVE